MDKEECEPILKQLYEEYVKMRVGQFRDFSYPLSIIKTREGLSISKDQIRRELENSLQPMGALRSMDIINHIKNYNNDEDLYKTYSKDALRTVVSDVRKNVEINKIAAQETGHLSVLDDNLEQIIECMELAYFPTQDYVVLNNLGSKDSPSELVTMISRVKSRKTIVINFIEQSSGSTLRILDGTIDYLGRIENGIDTEHPGVTWFSKLGSILKGSALIGADVAAAVFSSGATLFGSIPSVATGVVIIIDWFNEIKKSEEKKGRN